MQIADRLGLGGLRGKLILSFALVILLSLLVASGTFAYLLREYQTGREEGRLQEVAGVTTQLVVREQRSGQSLAIMEAELDAEASAAQTRVLLLDGQGRVLHDTQNGQLNGKLFQLPTQPGIRPGTLRGSVRLGSSQSAFAAVGPATVSGLRLAVVAPQQSLTQTWQELLPQIGAAGAISVVVSIAIAGGLAASITRPLLRITRASEEMAMGNFEQELPVLGGPDEVARLSWAFGEMAREVARSHRAMRDLLANVSHDLRTPLTSIHGFAGALVDGTLSGPEGAREAGHVIAEEAERMGRLVEDLLYLGRIQSGDLPLNCEPTDLAELARAGYVRFGIRAEERHVAFTLEAPRAVPVSADPDRLSQVLDNLLDNAFKYVQPGGEVILLVNVEGAGPASRGRAPLAAARAVMSVRNTGPAIPTDELDRVFERFYQVERVRARGGGRGLGLSIAREIVHAHGGTIAASSSSGAGTTFTVSLPILFEEGREPRLSSDAGQNGSAALPPTTVSQRA